VNAGDASSVIGALAGWFVGSLADAPVIDRSWRNGIENADVVVGIGESLARPVDQRRIEVS